MSFKWKVSHQCVLPTMMYGSQTWSLAKYCKTKKQSAQRAMERQVKHLTARCTTIRQQTGVADNLRRIKQLKYRWTGYVARKNDNRWTKRSLEWQPRKGDADRIEYGAII